MGDEVDGEAELTCMSPLNDRCPLSRLCFAQELRIGEPVLPNVADVGTGESRPNELIDVGESGEGALEGVAWRSLKGFFNGSRSDRLGLRLLGPSREGTGGARDLELSPPEAPEKASVESPPLSLFMCTDGCSEDMLCFGVRTTSALVNPSTCLTAPCAITGSTETSLESVLAVWVEFRTPSARSGNGKRLSPRVGSMGSPRAARTFGNSGGIPA